MIRFPQRSDHQWRWLPAVLAACLFAAPDPAFASEPETGVVTEVIVTARRREQPRLVHAGNLGKLDAGLLERRAHQHIAESMSHAAGAWIYRGSGQDLQAAIRSPALTGGGACGTYLVLEDGIPIRPAGFCTVNQFAEAHTEQAFAIEVIRGPGNALYGSNAMHGIVNVLMPEPGNARPSLALETGANDFLRLRATVPLDGDRDWLAAVVLADDGGFREDSGYRQGKLHVKKRGTWRGGALTLGFTATDLDQDTAGFVLGQDAYRDPDVRYDNPNPEAFRETRSQRLYANWTRALEHFDLDLRPYVRHSGMRFMHHALPGQPIEENGHVSAGLLSVFSRSTDALDLNAGMDLEWSRLFLLQTQDGPAGGSPRNRATRPEGRHYDYEVASRVAAPFVQVEYRAGERLALGAGLRLEHIQYDYRNRMLAGNTREDGTPCGFGGCLYTRPEDRTDRFTRIAPKLSASYRLSAQTRAFASLARGFRVPQALELYRLQNGQRVADLDAERIDSLELGLRTVSRDWSGEFTAYAMRKRDSVFRDSDGFNVSGARSRHAGLEASAEWRMGPAWTFSAAATRARHTYDFDYRSSRGESFVSGNDVDTAPRWFGSAELRFEPSARLRLGLQWTAIGPYFLDAGNRHRYGGHSLVNLRAGFGLAPRLDLVLRLNNVTERAYADRADFGGGNYRYLPGRGRELFLELRYLPGP